MPVGPYGSFEECVADNQDKDDPEAFCGWLKSQGASKMSEETGSSFQAEPGGGELPDGYRPALEEDVPEGRACGNCVFYDESRISEDGTMAWCSFWDAPVRGDHYCDAWADQLPENEVEAEPEGEDQTMSMSRASFETIGPDETLEVGEVEMALRWEGILTIEEELTGDGRMFTAGAVRWETLPVPLRWVKEDVGEHMNAVVVGRIDEVYREGNRVMGRGVFDVGSEEGREAARQVKENMTPGVSVDLDDVSFEIRVRAEAELQEPETDLEGRQIVMRYGPDDEVMITSDARLRAATIVATPAFADARIYLLDEMDGPEMEEMKVLEEKDEEGRYEELVASVSQISRPSVEAFKDPKLSGPTPLTIEDDGSIYGHLAVWGTCHVGFPGECVEAPSSASNYAYFRTGAVRTIEGIEVGVGRITLDTTHAGRRLGATDTAAHYEHTGVAVADVAAGEDAYGIWIAGVIRPGISEEQIRILQASPLSGDWRRIGGQLELVAALAVNSPGFPIPRALVAGGSVQSLQSSGVVAKASIARDDLEDEVLLKRLLERERKDLKEQKAAAQNARDRVLVAAASSRARRALRGR